MGNFIPQQMNFRSYNESETRDSCTCIWSLLVKNPAPCVAEHNEETAIHCNTVDSREAFQCAAWNLLDQNNTTAGSIVNSNSIVNTKHW